MRAPVTGATDVVVAAVITLPPMSANVSSRQD
jgi:hypothetical protein